MAALGISGWCGNEGRQCCRATGWGWRAAVMHEVTGVQQWTWAARRRCFWTVRQGWAAAMRRLPNLAIGGGSESERGGGSERGRIESVN
jgi:hypothetical protein